MKKQDENNKANDTSFDFEYWRDLAKSDPALFEEKRLAAVNDVIADAPSDNQQQLHQLQWRIDMERRRSKNPVDSCVRIYNMMWKQVYAKDGLLDALDTLLAYNSEEGPQKTAVKMSEKSADVLSFRAGSS